MLLQRTIAVAAILALPPVASEISSGAFWDGSIKHGMTAHAEEGFVSEDLGLDLYRKVDQGVGKLKGLMAEKRIPGNARKLNERLGKACKNVDGLRIDCLDPAKDFTLPELGAIEAGSVAPIGIRLAKGVVATADEITKIAKEAAGFASALKTEAGQQTQALGRMGSMGIFTDGSLDNSSYDLMKDLENVHDVIFAKDVPYGGMPNDGAKSVLSFGATPGFPSSRAMYDGYRFVPDVTVNPPAYAGSFSGSITASGVSMDAACSGTGIAGIDEALAFDIARQLAYGSNSASIGHSRNPTAPASPATVAGGNRGKSDNKTDSFPCFAFFCIRVDFIMYEQFLLWGGKTYSIESVLDENFKIVQKFGGSSFIQAGHTNNFFGPIWKNLNLPSLTHLGVVVQTMPPPILNLNAEQSPRGASKTSSEEKEFQEITAGTFKDFGIRYDKQNVIDDGQTAQSIRNLEELNSDEAVANLWPSRNPEGNYAFSKEAAVRQSYSDSFSNDLQEFRGFTQTFVDSIMNVGSLSKKYYEIPKGR